MAQERAQTFFLYFVFNIFRTGEVEETVVVLPTPLPFSQVSFFSSRMTAHLLGSGFTFLSGRSPYCPPDLALQALHAVGGHFFCARSHSHRSHQVLPAGLCLVQGVGEGWE